MRSRSAASLYCVLTIALTSIAAEAALADMLVVSSRGLISMKYPIGRKLPDGHGLKLARGERITLLSGGRTMEFRGPGTFRAGMSTKAAETQLSAMRAVLYAELPRRRARIGAARGTPERGIWDLDLRRTTVCALEGRPARLWTAAFPKGSIILRDGAGASAAIDSGVTTAEWPATLPMTDGAAYEWSPAEAAGAVQGRARVRQVFTLRTVAPPPASLQPPEALDHYAHRLAELGCHDQLELLARKLPSDK